MYFIRFLFTTLYFGIRVLLVRWRAEKQAVALLRDLEQRLNGRFDQATFRKVAKSHPIYLSIVNDAFTGLHGRTTTVAEQERCVLYFICSSLFDNFFDEHSRTDDEIYAMTFAPDTYVPKDFDDRAAKYAHTRLLNEVKDKQGYLEVLMHEYKGQMISREQFDPAITNERIQEICFYKCGNATLLCKYYLDVDASEAETAIWYRLGAFIQLCDDLFDIYFDVPAGINTLATRCTNAYEMETFFLGLIKDMQERIRAIPVSKARREKFAIAMAGIYSLGLVAIEQLKKLQGDAPQLPQFANLPRKTMIVDMERFGNMWRWFKFVYKYGKL